jgi:hypothetical protein
MGHTIILHAAIVIAVILGLYLGRDRIWPGGGPFGGPRA